MITADVDQIVVDVKDLVHTYTKENNPNQMDASTYSSLVELINAEGFLQPILVTRKGKKFKIVDGHHRVLAAQEIGIEKIPAVVTKVSDPKAAVLGIGMNNLRGDPDLAAVSRVLLETMEATNWEVSQLSLLSGMPAAEVEALTKQLDDDLEIIEDAAKSTIEEDKDEEKLNEKPYVLEISFSDKDTYRLVRRKLRKAAGKGNDLSVGLLSLLGEDVEQDG